ncbi:hypothetical protein [Caenimonas aquaedulcis]|uniref:5-carboxymethyl-2-hydroxymuconate isomerase n=1 Tax=Caenimonas aquaedulcis TaxID=2793270 RepID=A0A931MIW9_9BURK|nr:hypothetical protein [Caenimonas aquaedulcis]MBG9390586.1 hypothetical protein [Caenimonas aquaedulcis]
MPHLVLECTGRLAAQMDWDATLAAIHRELAERGYAAEHTIKSRVHVTAFYRSGQDPQAEQLVCQLLMTRERPSSTRSEMAELIHVQLSEAVARTTPSAWVQCAVLHHTAASGAYLLRQWNAPGDDIARGR